jgi:peptidoglycan hydrolase CwlO-like protein
MFTTVVGKGKEMNIDLTAIVVAFFGLLGTGGIWKYLENKTKLNHDNRQLENQANLEFRESLKKQIEVLNSKVDNLISEKEELLIEMAKIQVQLAEANKTILHLEEYIRNQNK